VNQIIEAIEKMTVMELVELKKALEEKFGVTAAAPMMMGAMPAMGAAAPVVEEKTEFDVVLTGAGAQKIQVIRSSARSPGSV
jgi:large subunit ribosomal protein L7/L12